jgi:hypothetical protein
LVWEARFRDRGYERGGEFTVRHKGKRTWTIVHADGRTETIAATDPALKFTSHAYAMTTERAQGKSIEAPIATMHSREGQAVAETKNYVNWSRLTRNAALVTDDAPRVLRMLALNDGRKPVALDHVRDIWEATRAGTQPPPDRELSLQRGLGSDADEAKRNREPARSFDSGPGKGGPSL